MTMQSFDAVLVGGGLVGASAALALARSGLEVAVIDQADPQDVVTAGFDGRASAIAAASARMFRALDLWAELAPHASPIAQIRVTDSNAPQMLHFDAADAGDEPLGYMFENRRLRLVLNAAMQAQAGLTLFAPDRIAGPPGQLPIFANSRSGKVTGRVTVPLESGASLYAPLLIAADGRHSVLRQAAAIRCARFDYGQSGLVTTVAHDRPHGQQAHEIFLPDGPLALLPLQGNRSSIVWTVDRADAETIAHLSDRALVAELEKRTAGVLGGLRIDAPRWSYPLSYHHAISYARPRFALIGDAAHGIHPIAGQGLNMGLRDVAALAQVLVEAVRLGLDIGSIEVLQRYENWRRPDNSLMCLATDSLNRLFATGAKPVSRLRRLGLAAVNRAGPLKLFFMQQAMGQRAGAPRLMTGEAL